MIITITWQKLKNKELPLSYVEANGNAYIYATSGSVDFNCVIDLISEDGLDWTENYKDQATSLV